jgi:hypothetical protein
MTDLYRAFDEAGQLLYVGISLRVWERLAAHKKQSGWYPKLVILKVTSLPSREAAEAAEIDAIKNEQPLFNKAYAQTQRPKGKKSGVTLIKWREAPVHAGVEGVVPHAALCVPEPERERKCPCCHGFFVGRKGQRFCSERCWGDSLENRRAAGRERRRREFMMHKETYP